MAGAGEGARAGAGCDMVLLGAVVLAGLLGACDVDAVDDDGAGLAGKAVCFGTGIDRDVVGVCDVDGLGILLYSEVNGLSPMLTPWFGQSEFRHKNQ